jgi:hypothetical protein
VKVLAGFSPLLRKAASVMGNYMKNTILFLTILAFVSCGQRNLINKSEKPFHLPIVIQPKTNDTIKYFNDDYNYLMSANPKFGGKYKFCDTLIIPLEYKPDTNQRNDFIDRGYKSYPDTFNLNGFEIIPDYKTTIVRVNNYEICGNKNAFYYYPVYVVNQTPTTKIYIGFYVIQEALDENGDWRPIEGKKMFFDNIGNDIAIKVHQKEFVTILIQKYRGNFKTKLRVRIKNGNNIYVTNPFEGTINKNQFYFDKEYDTFHYRLTRNNKINSILSLFYGAVPLECDEYYLEQK